uniref:Protein sidekick-1 n=1 Tax=Sphaerodactylus townsendi TaxID=933632 RepID=A0ACB8FLY0_9SAUR
MRLAANEGLWDLFAKDIPRSATSYSVSRDRLKQGVSYEFRVVAVNRFGYGEPSAPSAVVSAQLDSPFYEEWWFLIVMILCLLILVLLVVFTLILHSQTKKYKNCNTEPGQGFCLRSFCRRLSPGKNVSNMEESVNLDNGGFTALELNSRHLNVKNTFSKKNGTRTNYNRLKQQRIFGQGQPLLGTFTLKE